MGTGLLLLIERAQVPVWIIGVLKTIFVQWVCRCEDDVYAATAILMSGSGDAGNMGITGNVHEIGKEK